MIWPDPTDVGDVYAPAEDSDLLAAAAVERLDPGPGDRVLDVGTGSGYVAGRLAAAGADVVASDVNPHACRRARDRYGPGGSERPAADDRGEGDRQGSPVAVVRADLVAPFRPGSFDAVTFNPPYLPTDPEAERDDWMARALSGGPSGRAVIDRFLDDAARVLAPDGVVFLLVSSLTGVGDVVDRAGEEGFHAAAVRDESFPYETLTVLELFR